MSATDEKSEWQLGSIFPPNNEATLADGLYRVVQALGFDMGGAGNAAEFFGPMTYCTEDAWFTEPADIAVAYVTDYRKEMEAELDKYEAEIARLSSEVREAPTTRERPICGESCPYGGTSAARKFSHSDLGWMGHCNRRVSKAGEKCFQHRNEGEE